MSWDVDSIREIGNKTAETLKQYLKDNDGWRLSKKKGTTLVEYKHSTCEGYSHGYLYRGQCEMACRKDVIFRYIDPAEGQNSPRVKWDKDTREILTLMRVDSKLSVIRTMTNSAAMGVISPRDFIDVVLTLESDDSISTNGVSIENSQYPEDSKYVRGWNYPCGVMCLDVPGKPNHTRVVSFIQPDIRGMLPRSLVDSAIPVSMFGFFSNLSSILKKDGHIIKS